MLELSKILMYVNVLVWLCKTKILWESKLFYVDTDTFIVYIKTGDIYKERYLRKKDVETRFDTSNYQLDRLLPIGKNEKVIGLIKDELDGKSWWNLSD